MDKDLLESLYGIEKEIKSIILTINLETPITLNLSIEYIRPEKKIGG